MHIVLPITCLCGIVGLAYGDPTPQRPLLLNAPPVGFYIAARPGKVFYNVSPVDDLLGGISGRRRLDLDSLFLRNQRLIEALKTVDDNLAFSVDDGTNTKQKELFTKISYALLHYYDAEKDGFYSDLLEGFKALRTVLNETASVVAAPVRATYAKFVGAVANRVGVVQALCDPLTRDCEKKVDIDDRLKKQKCNQYERNVNLHNLALENVDSIERGLEIALHTAKHYSGPLGTLWETIKELNLQWKNDLKAVKEVYRTLKSSTYPCSYDVNAAHEILR